MFIGTHVFSKKYNAKTNTDNQIMMNDGNKYFLLLSFASLPPHRAGKNCTVGGGGHNIFFVQLEIFCPPPHLAKSYSPPLAGGGAGGREKYQ